MSLITSLILCAVLIISSIVITSCVSLTSSSDIKDVVIVGGGVSGLTALRTLLNGGVQNIILLEAQSKIGGRIHTYHRGSEVLEDGAEWIHGEHKNPVYGIAKNNSWLAPITQDEEWDWRVIRDDGSSHKEDEKLFVKIESFLEDGLVNGVLAAYYDRGYGQYYIDRMKNGFPNLDEKGYNAWIHYMEERINNDEGTQNWTDISAYDADQYIDYGEDHKWTNGYQTFIDYLTGDVNTELIKTHSPVEEIIWDGNNDDMVVVKNGSNSYRTKKVLIATSVGHLKKNNENLFQPKLPQKLSSALETIELGSPNKLFIGWDASWWGHKYLYANVVWRDMDLPSRMKWMEGIVTIFSQPQHPTTLLMFLSERYSLLMNQLPDKEVTQHLMFLFHKLFPDTPVPPPKFIRRTRWEENPWICGSYSSFITVKGYRDGTRSREIFRIPLANDKGTEVVFWAGEHTHDNRYGTVDGAYSSGVRSANEILANL